MSERMSEERLTEFECPGLHLSNYNGAADRRELAVALRAERTAYERECKAFRAAVVDGMQMEICTGALGPSVSTEAKFDAEVEARMTAFREVAARAAVESEEAK